MKALNLPEVIKQWQRETGIKWNFVVAKTGIKQDRLSRIVNGKQRPTVDDLAALQQITGIKFLN